MDHKLYLFRIFMFFFFFWNPSFSNYAEKINFTAYLLVWRTDLEIGILARACCCFSGEVFLIEMRQES